MQRMAVAASAVVQEALGWVQAGSTVEASEPISVQRRAVARM